MADVTGIVLAGGGSSRMGRDKASLVLGGSTLVQRVVSALNAVADEIVIVRAPGQTVPALETQSTLAVVEDPVEGEGPLVGIAAGLEAATAPVALVVGVDHPFLRPLLLRLLVERVQSGARWVLPVAAGHDQPLCCAFSRDALEVIRAHLDAGDRAPLSIADDLGVVRLAEEQWRTVDPEGLSFVDVDTPEDLEAARRRLRSDP